MSGLRSLLGVSLVPYPFWGLVSLVPGPFWGVVYLVPCPFGGWLSLVSCPFWGGCIPKDGYAKAGIPEGTGMPERGRYARERHLSWVLVSHMVEVGIPEGSGGVYHGIGIPICTPPSTDTYWQPLKHIRVATGCYASYWNAFLL